MFKTILVPIDIADHENADRAIGRACFLAEASGGTVHLLHVRSVRPLTDPQCLPPDVDAAEVEQCSARLEAFAAKLSLPRERLSMNVRRGIVYDEILDEAERLGADVIIIGSQMPSLTSRLLGSNASAVVRHARVDVLVVRG